MALAISATYNADTDSPGVSLTITGLSGTGNIIVRRIDNTLEDPTVVVRGFSNVSQTGTTMTGDDFEAPINRSVKYRVEADSATANSSNLTIPYASPGDVWIKSVGLPDYSRKVNVSKWPSTTFEPRILGNYNILGREKPVILTDVFGARKDSIEIVCYYDQSTANGGTWRDLENLLIRGGTLFLQCADNDFSGESDMYFEVLGLSKARLLATNPDAKPWFRYTIQFQETDQPSVSEVSLGTRSYQDVILENATYQAIIDEYPTYLELVQRAP